MGLRDLFDAMPFRAPDPSGQPAPLEKTVFQYEPTFWDKLVTSGPAQWVDQKLQGVYEELPKVSTIGASATEALGNVTSGLKWGLILAGALLALFVIVEFKNATR